MTSRMRVEPNSGPLTVQEKEKEKERKIKTVQKHGCRENCNQNYGVRHSTVYSLQSMAFIENDSSSISLISSSTFSCSFSEFGEFFIKYSSLLTRKERGTK